MRQIFNIIKKELDKILKSPRLLFSTLILPGLIIFVMYSVMGTVMEEQTEKNQEKTSIVQIHNAPDSFDKALEIYESILMEQEIELKINPVYSAFDPDNIDVLKKTIESKEVNAYIAFGEDFKSNIEKYVNGESDVIPEIKVIAYGTDNDSAVAYEKVSGILNVMSTLLLEENGIKANLFINKYVELSTPEEQSNLMSAMLLPMFIMMFVFAGGMAVGADAIAGEKERGTIATLLIAPIDRNKIVMGKVASTIIITLLSGVCSFIGSFMGIKNAGQLFGASSGAISFSTSIQLLVVILSIALFASCIFLIASTLAKSVKEATSYSMPFYIGGIIVSVIPTFAMDLSSNAFSYLVPLYNLAITTKGIFLEKITAMNFTLAIVSNLVYSAILIIVITRLFKSERLMFQK